MIKTAVKSPLFDATGLDKSSIRPCPKMGLSLVRPKAKGKKHEAKVAKAATSHPKIKVVPETTRSKKYYI